MEIYIIYLPYIFCENYEPHFYFQLCSSLLGGNSKHANVRPVVRFTLYRPLYI